MLFWNKSKSSATPEVNKPKDQSTPPSALTQGRGLFSDSLEDEEVVSPMPLDLQPVDLSASGIGDIAALHTKIKDVYSYVVVVEGDVAMAFGDAAAVAADLVTHEADTTTHGATGAIVGTTNVQTLYSKTLYMPTIDWFNNALHDHASDNKGGTIELADLSDTDTSGVALNKVLKWDGSDWVPGTAGDTTEFTFSIASFTDNESTTQLIGSGVWETTGNITFDATYNNGPPSAATVTMTTNGGGGVWGTNPLVMDSPYDSKATTENTAYPTSKDTYITFTLNTTPSDSDTETVYFRNYIWWGHDDTASSLTEADIEALASNVISNDTTRSMSITSVGTDYIVFAHPASYASIKVGSDYETDGHTGFTYNGIAVAMTLDSSTLSITNSAGFTENYKVYVSDLASLGDHTLVSSSGNATIDPLYYGKTTTTSGFSEADVEGLANSEVTNDNTQVWDSVTTGASEYMLFAFPKRLGTVTFWVGGFEGGFGAPETVSVTNVNGYTEDYYVWRSENANLGATVVTTT